MVKKGFFNDKCRCCLQNGTLTNMWDEHFREGEEEIYGEMMNKCFAIAWQKHEKETEKICELCISRLRDAIDFKKMVLTSEQVLLEYDEEINDEETEEECNNVFVEELHFEEVETYEVAEHSDEYMEVEYLEENVPSSPPKTIKKKDIKNCIEDILSRKSVAPVVKLDSCSTMRVKMENNANRIKDISSRKSVPAVKLDSCSTMRVKMENNANCIEDISSRKSVPVVKLDSCPTFRIIEGNDAKKDASRKRTTVQEKKPPTQSIKPILPKTVPKKDNFRKFREISSDEEFVDEFEEFDVKQTNHQEPAKRDRKSIAEERDKHQDNIKAVLLCSNATLLKRPTDQGYGCEFCTESFRNPLNLKRHILATHDDDVKSRYKRETEMCCLVFKLDITSLYCKLCNENIDTIENLLEHLKSVHEENVHTDVKRIIIPFKFHRFEFRCCICDAHFAAFRALSHHMTVHFKNFQCETCGKWYISKVSLNRHRYIHNTGVFPCSKCPKIFDCAVKRRAHQTTYHRKTAKAKCSLCGEVFNSSERKGKHLAEVHGSKATVPSLYYCNICDRNFSSKKSLKRHTNLIHLKMLDFKCDLCEKEFGEKRGLINHMLKHTGTKHFYCTICNKGFVRKISLTTHMEAHRNGKITPRRLDDHIIYTCDLCERKYPRKQALQRHIRQKHKSSLGT